MSEIKPIYLGPVAYHTDGHYSILPIHCTWKDNTIHFYPIRATLNYICRKLRTEHNIPPRSIIVVMSQNDALILKFTKEYIESLKYFEDDCHRNHDALAQGLNQQFLMLSTLFGLQFVIVESWFRHYESSVEIKDNNVYFFNALSNDTYFYIDKVFDWAI